MGGGGGRQAAYQARMGTRRGPPIAFSKTTGPKLEPCMTTTSPPAVEVPSGGPMKEAMVGGAYLAGIKLHARNKAAVCFVRTTMPH
jgi:hypothetical protein